MWAPVIIFVYNRADHVKKTIEALSQNNLAKESEIYIFSDGPKKEKDAEKVAEVRTYLKEVVEKAYFAKTNIIEAPKNKGLAKSIIDGVTQVMDKFGKVIVVEDDVVTSKTFLNFMNDALNSYESDKRIGSIGGISFIKNAERFCNDEVYFCGRMCSYGWATWKDRWENVDWQVKDYPQFRLNLAKRRSFNQAGEDLASMLDLQMIGKINSWAIRFTYHLHKMGMVTVYPVKSLATHIGADSGTHYNGVSDDRCNVEVHDVLIKEYLEYKRDPVVEKEFRKVFKRKLASKLTTFISRAVFKTDDLTKFVMKAAKRMKMR